METHMIRLKKLAGIIKEDTNQTNLMNRINKVQNQTSKKMLSDIAIAITDIKGYVMDIEDSIEKEYKTKQFFMGTESAHKSIDILVKKLEDYVKNIQKMG